MRRRESINDQFLRLGYYFINVEIKRFRYPWNPKNFFDPKNFLTRKKFLTLKIIEALKFFDPKIFSYSKKYPTS